MKKTIVTALVVLLLMLAVTSCDSIIDGLDAEKAEYTADGRRLVTLNIKTTTETAGGNRSINLGIAQGNANYMEVIFKDGANLYRGKGSTGVPLTVRIPTGDYDSTNAFILIGRRSDNTLLATGTPNSLTNVVVGGDNTITFSVNPLLINTSVTGSSSFAITNVFTGGESEFNGQTKEGLMDDSPCFQVPISTAITATLTIGGFGTTGGNIIFVNDTTTVPNITPTITFIGGASGNKIDDATISSSGAITSGNKVFNIGFTTKAADNYIITFEIPVVGFDEGTDAAGRAPITWIIRGGTDKEQAAFSATDSEEGIALAVATSTKRLINVDINPPGL